MTKLFLLAFGLSASAATGMEGFNEEANRGGAFKGSILNLSCDQSYIFLKIEKRNKIFYLTEEEKGEEWTNCSTVEERGKKLEEERKKLEERREKWFEFLKKELEVWSALERLSLELPEGNDIFSISSHFFIDKKFPSLKGLSVTVPSISSGLWYYWFADAQLPKGLKTLEICSSIGWDWEKAEPCFSSIDSVQTQASKEWDIVENPWSILPEFLQKSLEKNQEIKEKLDVLYKEDPLLTVKTITMAFSSITVPESANEEKINKRIEKLFDRYPNLFLTERKTLSLFIDGLKKFLEKNPNLSIIFKNSDLWNCEKKKITEKLGPLGHRVTF